MRIFLYEFVTGGGLLCSGEAPVGSLLQEGSAMLAALAEDLNRLPAVDLHWMCDQRFAEEKHRPPYPGTVHWVQDAAEEVATFQQLSAASDWTIVIAPEIAGHLLRRCEMVNEVGGQLLGPSLKALRLTSDKQQTIEYLKRQGISVPEGQFVPEETLVPSDFEFPAVCKPIDGAGSLGIVWIESAKHAVAVGTDRCARRLERYCPGLPVSVAFLCSPTDCIGLPPFQQFIERKAGFAYRGGQGPLERGLSGRASKLAWKAVTCLPPLLGYVGVDLILGPAADGSEDVIIEINPRITTSYVGLRVLSEKNLAAVMLGVVLGNSTPLSFRDEPLQFWVDGQVQPGMSPLEDALTKYRKAFGKKSRA